MKIFDLIDETLYNEMVDLGYINVTKHPVFDLWILNYSKECQFMHAWNDATETCRGLIIDMFGNIVARPFRKFYNYEELVEMGKETDIPTCSFEAYEKLDGSLGIMYWGADGKPYISTRGSFSSEQAQHATAVLHEKYSDYFDKLDRSKTYLFEIIYPEDLHVVTYKNVDDIFLLAVVDTATGVEDDIYNWSYIFNCTKRYDGVTDYLKIREMFSGDNKEGFVIRFANGFRMKLKFAEYWKLHFLKAGFTEKAIFGYMASDNENAIDEAMSMFDEEHQIYYNNIIKKIMDAYNNIADICFDEFRNDFDSRADAAAYFKKCEYPAILFLMYDKRKTDQAIWNAVSQRLYNRPWNLKAYLINQSEKFYNTYDE